MTAVFGGREGEEEEADGRATSPLYLAQISIGKQRAATERTCVGVPFEVADIQESIFLILIHILLT